MLKEQAFNENNIENKRRREKEKESIEIREKEEKCFSSNVVDLRVNPIASLTNNYLFNNTGNNLSEVGKVRT